MKQTIDRTKQINFNTDNNQTPQALNKIDNCFYKNPLVEYELGLTVNAAGPQTEYTKPRVGKSFEKTSRWKKQQKN
jgi:excinuclease ABC subunit B